MVAHEYSHHLQGHGRLVEATSDSGADPAARGEEYEADSIAIMLGQSTTGFRPKENLYIISGVGMVVLLSAMGMLREAQAILGFERAGMDGTHPSVSDRLAMVDRQDHL